LTGARGAQETEKPRREKGGAVDGELRKKMKSHSKAGRLPGKNHIEEGFLLSGGASAEVENKGVRGGRGGRKKSRRRKDVS